MTNPAEKNYARIFVSFPVPSLQAEALEIIRQQNSLATGIRWTQIQNLHVTIFFLGEVLEENLPAINRAISFVTVETLPFNLTFEKITFAGKLKHGGMIWARFLKSNSYASLSGNIYHAVREFLLTQPVFKDPIPHITLARFKRETDLTKINLTMGFALELPSINYCELWKTIQTKEGVLYKSLGRFDFRK
jgi:2'-5' RNA ligase